MKAKLVYAIFLILCASPLLLAQTSVKIQRAELSVPFGVAEGRIILVGEYLVFVDDDKPDASFAIAKNEIRSMVAEAGVLTVETHRPIRDRSGERSLLSFRLSDVDAASVMDWSSLDIASTPSETARTTDPQPGQGSTGPGSVDSMTYEVKHKHFLGSCRGTLMITEDRITYESTDDVGHARQWQLRDIREVKQSGPYIFEVEPFTGDKYKFELLGKGMDVQDYKTIVARITAARVAR